MSSPWRVRNSSRSDGQRPVEDDQPAARVERRPGRAQDRRRVVAAGGARTGSRPGRTRRPGPGSVTPRLADRDPVGQPGRLDLGPRPGDRIRLELDADELERREAPRHRDEPSTATAVDVDDASAPRQVGDELRQLGQRLLEEDRDVLARSAARWRPGSGPGRSRDRLAGPEEVDHPAPVERGDRRRGRTGRRGIRSGASSSRITATSSSTVRRSSSSVTRSCASAAQAHASIAGWLAAGRRGELVRRQPGRPGFAERGRTARARCRGR